MADPRPAVQLLKQVFSEQKCSQYGELTTYLEQGGSIVTLVEKGVPGLVRDYGVDPDEARQFLRRANSMAIYVRRQYIEHILHGDESNSSGPSSGLLSLVQGPTFERLFYPRFESMCPADALESVVSPVAYLIELLRWIEKRIESSSSQTDKLLLHERRSDLKALSVDFNAVHRSIPSVDIIGRVLEAFIAKHGATTDLEEAMIEARYPNGLPYYQHWVTLKSVAQHHGLSIGNFAHMVDRSFPYFLQAQAWDNDAGRALAHASGLGPYQRKLLTEALTEFDDRETFYSRNFGTDNHYMYLNLGQVPFIGDRTKLSTRALEALLSVRSFAPERSANVTFTDVAPAEPESGRSGSVYLNANGHPAVSISGSGDGDAFLHRLSVDPNLAEDFPQFERINRKVRLDQWLQLPSEETDGLLAAAMRAEVRGGATAGEWWITDNVVHALGLFELLRERYRCTAQDFSVFIDELSVYGRGEVLSQFDQVFNGQGGYRQPLKLDDVPFPVLPAPGEADLTITQICSALGIDLQTYSYLALAIVAAQRTKDGNLLRNVTTLSSFYRLVKLPRMLGMTPVEGVLMLTLLGGESWLKGLAGVPQINKTTVDTPDALNLIYAMHSCAQWCAERKIAVLWMLQQVSAPQALAAPSDNELQLFEQVRNLLPGALFTNAALLMAGVPQLPGASWLDLLTRLVDTDGLVLARTVTEAEYLAFARATLDTAVSDGLGESNEAIRAVIVEKMLGVLLDTREAQASVVKECLAVYTGLSAEPALLVMIWANATVHRLLRQILERTGLDLDESVRGRDEQPDPLLTLLADVRRRSAVVTKLELSVEALQDYLDYGHKAWLGQDDRHAFTVRTLYYLTTLTRAFELSEQPAQKLLDYLREVNALPSPLTGDALKLAQQAASIRLAEFFDWSVQEVRECVDRIDPTLKILKNLTQLDLLMRIRVLAAHTGMDALTIFLIGTLPEAIDKPKYEEAAELALLSLSEASTSVRAFSEDLKQIVTMTCTADKTEAVANNPADEITFTVTLKDSDGKPLSGVNVYWSATLGTIATAATQPDGTVKATFKPGKVMGTDTPQFWLDLFEPEHAPTIHVVADNKSLQFPPPFMSGVPSGPVAYGEEIELYAILMDKFGNLGKNSLVIWSAPPKPPDNKADSAIIRPAQGYTNQDGLTRVFVSSPSGGTFEIEVTSAVGNTSALFDLITFDRPGDRQ